MARLAIVDKDGQIVNVVVADKNFEPPPEHSIIEHDEASPNLHRVVRGKVERIPVSKDALIAHIFARFAGTISSPHIVHDRTVWVDDVDQPRLGRLADAAMRNHAMTVQWVTRSRLESVTLTATDLVVLNESVIAHEVALLAAAAGTLAAVKAGEITTDEQVDNPPGTLPKWPRRYIDK